LTSCGPAPCLWRRRAPLVRVVAVQRGTVAIALKATAAPETAALAEAVGRAAAPDAAALRRSGIAYPPGRCRVSREANVSTSVERCGCDESGTVSFGRSRLVARQCPGEVLASVEHAPRYGTPRAPPRGGRAGACQRHLLGPGDQRRRPAEPRRLCAVPTRDFSSMEPTTAHCPAVRPRSSGVTVVDPVALVPSRWSPGPAATTTLTRRPTQTQPPHLTAASSSEVEGVDSRPVVGVPDRALVATDVQDPVGAGEPAGRDRADAVARRVVGQLP